MDGYPILELAPPSIPTWIEGILHDGPTGDVYASRHGALEQARHVFLGGNELPERFAGKSPFVLGELGFGTGLNFLATWHLWNKWRSDWAQHAAPLHPNQQRLIYISIEHNPLPPEVILAAAKKHPELLPLAQRLVSRLPPRLPGFHQILWEADGVELILIQGDAGMALKRLEARVDAWFLDGFAPTKNPGMWSAEILRQVGNHTAPGGTFATWCVAGAVRRGLEEAGFAVEKREGFAQKKEMLVGMRGERGVSPAVANHVEATREILPSLQSRTPMKFTAVVVGAGLAGCCVARALARRGAQVTVIESAPEPARGASGNPAGILLPNATKIPTPLSALTEAGFLRTLDLIDDLAENSDPVPHRLDGALKLAPSEDLTIRLKGRLENAAPTSFTRWVETDESYDIVGTPTAWGGLYYPRGGWIAPRELCIALLNHSGITLKTSTTLIRAHHIDGAWTLGTADQYAITADALVLTTGAHPFEPLPLAGLTPVRGQILSIPSQQIHMGYRVVSYGGYVIPDVGGSHMVGTTYDKNDTDISFRSDQVAPILEEMKAALPHVELPDAKLISGRAGLRAFSRDHQPLAGQGPHGAWVLNGLSSRGLTLAPLLGEFLAARIMGEPCPLEIPLATMMDPGRKTLKTK
ncbi:MAG: FAD-dependent 5-carboxymethylaminomethyl-2-thiouridine(34) oxidoreductase MnmC [Planctomycetota bacterium]